MSEFVVDLTDVPTKTVKDPTSSDALAHLCGLPVREQIVRCKDCEHFAVDQSDHEYRSGWWCKRWDTNMVKPDGYCAWASRKESDGDPLDGMSQSALKSEAHWWHGRALEMEANNEKLRKLVLDMWDFFCVVHDDPLTFKEELDFSVEVWKRMRALGIETEVDE